MTVDRRIDGAERVGKHKTSMLQDVEAGRDPEIDALVGSVIELGRLTHTPTPHISSVLRVREAAEPHDGDRARRRMHRPARAATRERGARHKPRRLASGFACTRSSSGERRRTCARLQRALHLPPARQQPAHIRSRVAVVHEMDDSAIAFSADHASGGLNHFLYSRNEIGVVEAGAESRFHALSDLFVDRIELGQAEGRDECADQALAAQVYAFGESAAQHREIRSLGCAP